MDRRIGLMLCPMIMCMTIVSCNNKYVIKTKDLSGAIQNISFQRELAELYVSMSKVNIGDNSYSARVIQEKYGRAAALANSFITKLQFSLTARDIDSDGLTQDVKQVATAVNDLYASTVSEPFEHGKATKSVISELVPSGLVDSIVKSAITVWKAAKERDDKLIEDMKKELDKQRWKSWKDLPKTI